MTDNGNVDQKTSQSFSKGGLIKGMNLYPQTTTDTDWFK